MGHITNLYKAVRDQDEKMLLNLLGSPDVVYDIDREYEEFRKRPLLYGHLTRRGEIPSPAITNILIANGANVNYHKFNSSCCSICDALPDHDYDYPKDRHIEKWNGKYSSDSIESLYDNMRLLVHAGADVNALGDGRNALMQAASGDDMPAARFLLNNHANVALRDASGICALFKASNPESSMSEHVNPAMIELLFEYGADPDTKFEGKSCGAMCAGYKGCPAVFKAARIRKIETMQIAELKEYDEYNEKSRDDRRYWSDEDREEPGDDEECSAVQSARPGLR